MRLLKSIKGAFVRSGKSLGLFNVIGSSRWRASRLLILGYHGISLEDEHEWDGALYMSPSKFRSRLETIKRQGCNVLDLQEALELMAKDKLPARSVVLTFDDGTYDFYKAACPILSEYRFPATVYLTTYWMTLELPVVPVAWRYILWKARESVLDASGLLNRKAVFDLHSANGRADAVKALFERAERDSWPGEQRDEVSRQLAELVGFDYWQFRSKRLLQLLRPDEIKSVAAAGFSVQLHTHRHRTPIEREACVADIKENRRQISQILGSDPKHFCFPNGRYTRAQLPWLREAGVISATTCETGIVSSSSEPLLLRRLIDTSFLSDTEFEGWLNGFGALLPHQIRRRPAVQLQPPATAVAVSD